MALPRRDLYLPIDPRQVVQGVLPESATPMQSAAKVPILVAFTVVAQVLPGAGLRSQKNAAKSPMAATSTLLLAL